MKKWLIAVAMLFATQAGAATVDATITSTSTSGTYNYHFGLLDPVELAGHNAWELRLFLRAQDGDPWKDIDNWIVGVTSSDMSPSGATLQFSTKETVFSVMGELRLFTNAFVDQPTTYDQFNFIVQETDPSTTDVFQRTASFGTRTAPPEPEIQASVVPIGGTLPLMITALGLGGLLLRARRAA